MTTYYHGSPENLSALVVRPLGSIAHGHDFGGIFLATQKYGHIGQTEQNFYSIDLSESDILTTYDLYYSYSQDDERIKSVLAQFRLDSDDDEMWDLLCERNVTVENINEKFGDGWTQQTIQGQIAKALGYQAFEMTDERGVVLLYVGSAPLRKEIDVG